MAPFMRIAILLSLGCIIAAPGASLAQIPALAEKAQELATDVRERGAELLPLYQDVEVKTPPRREHKARPKPRGHLPRENSRVPGGASSHPPR